jgi:hypothetical protein
VRPQSAKAKGRRLQQYARDRFLAVFKMLGADDISSRSMGAAGEDLLLSPRARRFIPFSVECKNQEALNIWKALEQADRGDRDPLLVFKRNHSDTYCALPFDALLDLLEERAHGIHAQETAGRTGVAGGADGHVLVHRDRGVAGEAGDVPQVPARPEGNAGDWCAGRAPGLRAGAPSPARLPGDSTGAA